jgi:GT2 family glycosyltransferase
MIFNIPKIAVLLTCHNRKDKTLKCLAHLYQQKGLATDFSIEVFLVDDASTDGTAAAISRQFPAVHIIAGNGSLYWNRGMNLAWKTASTAKDFDYYLWLNDDTFLRENTIAILLQSSFSDAIIAGTTRSAETNKITYGGFKQNINQLIIPNGTYQECDYCNGNCVLIPRKVFQIVGNLDLVFNHALGDFDYSMRAVKLGFRIYLAPDFIGFCESHSEVPNWRRSTVHFTKRLKSLYLPTSGCNPIQFFVFDNRHNGIYLACVHFFSIHLRLFFPSLWK